MRRSKVTAVAIAVLALLVASSAMAANDLTVDSVLAIEYDNGVFAAAVLAHGPVPLAWAKLSVKDKFGNFVEVVPDRESQVVIWPAKNLTLFKFFKFGPDAVIQPGYEVKAEVTDTNGDEEEKVVNCVQGRFHQLVVCR